MFRNWMCVGFALALGVGILFATPAKALLYRSYPYQEYRYGRPDLPLRYRAYKLPEERIHLSDRELRYLTYPYGYRSMPRPYYQYDEHSYGDMRLPYRFYTNPYAWGYHKPYYSGRFSRPEMFNYPFFFDFDRDASGFLRIRDFNDRDPGNPYDDQFFRKRDLDGPQDYPY